MAKIITSNATSSGSSGTITQLNADWNSSFGVTEILNKPGQASITNDGLMSSTDKVKLNGVQDGAEQNAVDSVSGRTGVVVLSKSDVGLANVDNTSDASKPISTAVQTALTGKASTSVATTSANGLLSSTDKTKLDGVATGANNYTHPTTHPPSIIAQDVSNRFVTDAEKVAWNGKETAFTKNTAFNKDFGTGVGTVTQGNDSRLSDARTPVSHTHGNITNGGAIGTTANLVIQTTTSGVLTAKAVGTTAQYLRGDGSWGTPPDTTYGVATSIANGLMASTDKVKIDTVATNANNYTHPVNHPPSIITQDASNRFVTDTEKTNWNSKEPSFSKNTAFNKDFGTGVGTVTQGNDSRLSDARNPLAHTQAVSTITGLQSELDSKILLGDTLQNTNPFGGRKLYINTLDNVLATADKKYYVTATIHKKVVSTVSYPRAINVGNILLPQWEDSPVVSTLDASQLFNNAYEGGVGIPSDSYGKIKLDFNSTGTDYFSGYPYGTYYLSYYYTSTPERAEVRCYNGYAPHGTGYKTNSFSDYIGTNTSASYIQQLTDNGNYQRRGIEFIIFGNPNHSTNLTQIEWKLSRPNFSSNTPIFSNYGVNKSYHELRFGTQVDNNVVINPNGNITALAFIGNASTSTKLFTPRLINGVSFDGSANITIVDSTKEPSFTKNTAFNKNFGTGVGTVTEGNDSRLSDARTPLTHTHTIANVTNLQSSLDAKANTVSPTFTGTPLAPTATIGTNTTQIATTAFVQSSLSGAGLGDMLKSVYDTNNNGIVDYAHQGVNGTDYTTSKLRNIRLYEVGTTLPTLADGEVLFVYDTAILP